MEEEDIALCPRTASFTVRTVEPWNQAQTKSCDRNGKRPAAPRSVLIWICCQIFFNAVTWLKCWPSMFRMDWVYLRFYSRHLNCFIKKSVCDQSIKNVGKMTMAVEPKPQWYDVVAVLLSLLGDLIKLEVV